MSSIYAKQIEEVMPDGWTVRPFEDLVFFQEGPGIRNWQYVPKGIPFVNIRCLVDGRLDRGSMNHVSKEEALGKYNHFLLDAGDYVVSSSGTLGRIATVDASDLPCMLNTSVIRMRPKGHDIDRRFLKYFLISDYYQSQILSFAAGSAQLNYGPMHLRQMFIVVPPISEQRAIAHILGTLDDKIELNRRMSETLEQMARALFKSWFVDFDPVRAKMEGRWQRGQSLPGLPAHLYDLFPDRLVESELGEIPQGWCASTVRQHFRLTMGQSPPGSTYNEIGEGVPFYQGRTDFGFRFPTRRVFCTAPARFAETGDTLVSVRAPVGDVNIANERCAVGRGVAAIRHRSGSRSFTYYSMNHLGEHFGQFEAEGTVFGCINKADFERLPFVAPAPDILTTFDRSVSPLDDRLETNERQSLILASIRDTLLPKLISGELRVKDAEKFLQERGL